MRFTQLFGSQLRTLRRFMAFFLLGVATATTAQTLYGNLNGIVTDSSGAIIPNAHIQVTGLATGASREAISRSDGSYQIGNIAPGTYKVVIASPGFKSYEVSAIEIAANNSARVDGQMVPGNVSTEMTVTDAPPPLQTERGDVQYQISQTQVAELPTTSSYGRNFQSLFKLVPGVQPPIEQNTASANPGRSQAINFNGVANTINSTRIDGAIAGSPWLPALTIYMPSQDAIDNVNVVSNSFTAEQGTAGGGAVNIFIKSGTNQFHGTAYEYNSITQFNARNYFYTKIAFPVVPKNIYNEFGGSIGGPILKNKLFFFVDFNRVTSRAAVSNPSLTVIPTAVRSGDFSSIPYPVFDPTTGTSTGAGRTQFSGNVIPTGRLSAAALKLISWTPKPNNSNPTTGNYSAGGVLAYNRNSFDTKINYNPTSKSSIFGRYSIQPSNIFDPPALGQAGGPAVDGGQAGYSLGRVQSVGLGATHVFTPNLLMDAAAGYFRARINGQDTDYGHNYGLDDLAIPGTNGTDPFYSGIPIFNISNGTTSLGNTRAGNPFKFRDQQYSGNVNLSWIRGKHQMRFGGEYVHSAINHAQGAGNGPRGNFTFNGGATGNNDGVNTPSGTAGFYRAIADFLLGVPNTMGKTLQQFIPNGPRFSTFAFYAQDQWQVSPRLTLTYGLRYEYYTLPVRDHTGIFRYDPASGNVLIGGVGTTPYYTGVDGGKGGLGPRFGLNYRVNPATVFRGGYGIATDPENFRSLYNSYPGITSASYTGTTYIPAGDLRTGIPTIPVVDISSGVIVQPSNIANTTIPKVFRRGYVESWNTFIEHSFARDLVFGIGYVGMRHVRMLGSYDINAAPFGSTSASQRPLKNSLGQTITVAMSQLEPRFDENYHALQTQLAQRHWSSLQFGYAYTWSHGMNNYEQDSSQVNAPFNSAGLFYKNYGNSAKDRTNNHAIWLVAKLPFGKGHRYLNQGMVGRLVGGWDVDSVVQKASGTPIQLTDSTFSTFGDTQTPNLIVATPDRKLSGDASSLSYLNRANFTTGGSTTPGNVGRNSVRGPGFYDVDLALGKNFALWREYTFLFKVEALNLTNTPQFSNPASDYSSSANFGKITSSNPGRTVRLSGRIRF